MPEAFLLQTKQRCPDVGWPHQVFTPSPASLPGMAAGVCRIPRCRCMMFYRRYAELVGSAALKCWNLTMLCTFPNGMNCFTCWEYGHFKRSCPNTEWGGQPSGATNTASEAVADQTFEAQPMQVEPVPQQHHRHLWLTPGQSVLHQHHRDLWSTPGQPVPHPQTGVKLTEKELALAP